MCWACACAPLWQTFYFGCYFLLLGSAFFYFELRPPFVPMPAIFAGLNRRMQNKIEGEIEGNPEGLQRDADILLQLMCSADDEVPVSEAITV